MYVPKFPRCVLRNVPQRNVPYVRYGSLRIDMYGSTVRYGFLRYVTLREGGKQALRMLTSIGDAHYVDGVGPGIGARVDRDTPYRPGVQA